VAIAGALVVSSYYYITDAMCDANWLFHIIRVLLVVFGTLMSFTSVLTAIKHRFFRAVWLEELKRVEIALNLRPIPMFTKEAKHPRGKNKWWENRSAEKWLIFSLLFLTITFGVLSAFTIAIAISNIPPLSN
jgi:hypothetical protein